MLRDKKDLLEKWLDEMPAEFSEKQNKWEMCRCAREDLLWEFTHVHMEVEKSHNMLSASQGNLVVRSSQSEGLGNQGGDVLTAA